MSYMNWASLESAMLNHLWQSTVFAAVVAVAALLLRRNQARVRHGLWAAASVKFLLPFSLLVGLGGLLPHGDAAEAVSAAQGVVYDTVDRAGTPFSDAAMVLAGIPMVRTTHGMSVRERTMELLPEVLLGVWACGAVMVLLVWMVRWRRVRAILRRAVTMEDGREAEILRRVADRAGMHGRVKLMLSQDSMEPGIFGVWRPRLIWPEGLSKRLEDEHIAAIVAHELMHVRRRDNLTAMLHMAVEAVFWFHPMVWWMERRLMEERERACDEAVVEMGSRPGVYADGLLKAVRFCVESPLACVAGITGADLSRRIRSIMTLRLERMSWGRKMMLAGLAVAVVAGPVVFGQVKQELKANAKRPAFEVAAIRLEDPNSKIDYNDPKLAWNVPQKFPANRLVMRHTMFYSLICEAYDVRCMNVLNMPSWMNSKYTHYDISAKIDGDALLTFDQMKPMMQTLLEERFHLKFHREHRIVAGYALVVAKGGPKLTPTKGGTFNGMWGGMEMKFQNDNVENFAKMITGQLKQPVVDRTGIKGQYDIDLKFLPENSVFAEVPRYSGLPNIYSALQNQLGLKLVPARVPEDFIVVDYADRIPTEN